MEGDSHPTYLFGSVGFNVAKTTPVIYRWSPFQGFESSNRQMIFGKGNEVTTT